MNYNFIEIGTSNFLSITQFCPQDWNGIAVEPLQEYLDQLPSKPNVAKLNFAVLPSDTETQAEIFYIPEETIKKYNLEGFLIGCNKVGEMHPAHVRLGYEYLVKTRTVPATSLSRLFDSNNVESVLHLKLDAVGLDADILTHFAPWLQTQSKTKWPLKIEFRALPEFTSPEKKQSVVELYVGMGYILAGDTSNTVKLFLQ